MDDFILACTNNPFMIIWLAVIAILLVVLIFTRNRRHPVNDYDELDGHEFEYYCANLLKDRGFVDVSITKGSGDFGVDILAEKDGVTYAIQCKKYDKPVGVRAIEEVYMGRDYYDRMVGAVLTNQYFTAPAVAAASKLHILLWDGGYLQSMVEESYIK